MTSVGQQVIATTKQAARQIVVYENSVEASFVLFCDLALLFCDLAFQVGRGLVPHQPCFGVLTADGSGSWDAQWVYAKTNPSGASPKRMG